MKTLLHNAPRYWKGILGFAMPGLVVVGSAITGASDGGSRVTTYEWVTAALACLITGGAVTAKSNVPPKGQPSDPNVSEVG